MDLGLQLLLNGLGVGAIYALFALGFGIIFSVTRMFHLAHGASYTLAAYAFYWSLVTVQLGVPVSIVIASAVAVAVAVACELIVYRPLRRRGADEKVLLVASLALLVLFENVISMVAGSQPLGLPAGVAPQGEIGVFGAALRPGQILVVAVSGVVYASTLGLLATTVLGRRMTAVGDNRLLAELSGIAVDRVYIWSFIIGSVIAAAAAILVSQTSAISPSMGLSTVLIGSVAVILAGNGRLLALAGAGLALGIIENLALWGLDSRWQPAVTFAVLLVVLLLRPYGLFSTRQSSFAGAGAE